MVIFNKTARGIVRSNVIASAIVVVLAVVVFVLCLHLSINLKQ